jgi:hypothetical protein
MGYSQYWDNPSNLPASIRMVYTLDRTKSLDSVKQEFDRMLRYPNYVIFYRRDSLEQRVQDITRLLEAESLKPVAEFEPSSLDKLLHILNPRIHKKNDVFVYEVID